MEDRQLNRLLGIARSLVSDHKLPTPFLFIDEDRARESLGLFRRYLPHVDLYYAIKANSSPELVRFFADEGLSFDVASAGELALVRALGIPNERLFLSTPIKTADTLDAMFQHEVPYAAVDTVEEVERIAAWRKAGRYPYAPALFVRIRIESRHVEIDLNKKFGCTIDEALAIVERAADLKLPLGGVCFHVGSQSTSADNYFLGIERAMRVAKEAWHRFKIRLPLINIGGGFCDASAAHAAGVDLDTFYQAIGTACEAAILAGFKVIAEPGRALVGSAGALVSSVVGTNIRDEHRWAYLDDGIYGCFSIRLYEKRTFEFRPVNPVRKARPLRIGSASGTWTVAGPSCDSVDVIADKVELSLDLAAGDLLLTPGMGAYTVATASRFNGFQPPACYLVQATGRRGKFLTSIRATIDNPTPMAETAKVAG